MVLQSESDVLIMFISTITYDTLVRAGISCTSAYVVADSTLSPPSTAPATASGAVPSSPVVARGSRGIRILPDTSFSGFGARVSKSIF